MSLKLQLHHQNSAKLITQKPSGSFHLIRKFTDPYAQRSESSRFDNNHIKPFFHAPVPRDISIEEEPQAISFCLNDLETQPRQPTEQVDLSINNQIINIPPTSSFKNPKSPTPSCENKSVNFLVEPTPRNLDVYFSPKEVTTPTTVKDNDIDASHCASEVVNLTDMNQIDVMLMDSRKSSMANILGKKNVPSRFADKNNRSTYQRIESDIKAEIETIKEERSQSFHVSADMPLQEVKRLANFDQNAQTPFQARKKWRQLSHTQEVTSISKAKDITSEITNFQPRTWKDNVVEQNGTYKREGTKEAFHAVRTIQTFCECAMIGSEKHIAIMKEILANDPKRDRDMLESKDPSHILNRHNPQGFTPMSLAAQNGNLEIVKFLVEYGADPLIGNKIIQKNGESNEVPLELAVRWSHIKIVEYFLSKCDYPSNIIKKCLKYAENKNIKEMLNNYLKNKKKD